MLCSDYFGGVGGGAADRRSVCGDGWVRGWWKRFFLLGTV